MSTSNRVVITYEGFDMEGELAETLRAAGCELHLDAFDAIRRPGELAALFSGAFAGIVDTDPFDRDVLQELPGLRILARAGVGLDAIDLDFATARGIAVTTTPGVNHETVADHTLALMLACLRRIPERDTGVKAGGWARFGENLAWNLHGTTVGLIGYGRIGASVARRLEGFDVEILVHDPLVPASVDLEYLLSRSDIVSLHCPLTADTTHLMNGDRFAQMKRHAVLVNTARGGLVDERALLHSLDVGHLRAAGLDVFEAEPPAASHLRVPGIIASPHIAGISERSNLDMCAIAANNVLSVLNGGSELVGLANPGALASSAQNQKVSVTH